MVLGSKWLMGNMAQPRIEDQLQREKEYEKQMERKAGRGGWG